MPAGQVEGHPVQMHAQELPQPDVRAAHQGQGRQEVLAELPVGDPGAPFGIGLQGQGVDQNGAAFQELDVVRAGVLEPEPSRQSAPLDLQGGRGGVLKLAETPLVGIGDERDFPGAQDLVGPLRGRQGQGDFFVGNQKSRPDEFLVEPARHEAVVGFATGGLDLAVKDPVAPVDESRRIAERRGPRVGRGRDDRTHGLTERSWATPSPPARRRAKGRLPRPRPRHSGRTGAGGTPSRVGPYS